MQEQTEPDERMISSLCAKITQRREKQAPSFLKFMPLTTAACLVIAATILIMPMVTREDSGELPALSEQPHEASEPPATLTPHELPEPSESSAQFTLAFIYPLSGEYLISEFGHWNGGYHGHTGLDFEAPEGTPVYASAGGGVILAGWHSGYGLTVIIDHGDGIKTLYAHCKELLVSEGQSVTQGEVIAHVGMTGMADHTHLHFEVHENDVAVNPWEFLFS